MALQPLQSAHEHLGIPVQQCRPAAAIGERLRAVLTTQMILPARRTAAVPSRSGRALARLPIKAGFDQSGLAQGSGRYFNSDWLTLISL